MSKARRWCFTVNNYTDHEYTSITGTLSGLLEVDLRYAIVAREEGTEGTPHLQGYFSARREYTFKQAKALIGDRAHLEAAKGNDHDNQKYCSKEGDYVEYGSPVGKGGRTDLALILREAKSGKSLKEIAEIDPATYVRNYRGIASYMALQQEAYEHDKPRGIWIWGPPGTGKSHHARAFNPASLYLKAQNKWWDGYAGEEIVLLDDLDTNVLGHYLKIWADKWSCTGEIKGGTIKLRHKYFIVTANYAPCELFAEDKVLCNAITRRFEVIFMGSQRETLRPKPELIQTNISNPVLTKYPSLTLT